MSVATNRFELRCELRQLLLLHYTIFPCLLDWKKALCLFSRILMCWIFCLLLKTFFCNLGCMKQNLINLSEPKQLFLLNLFQMRYVQYT